MKNTLKRTLSLVLTVCMLLSVLPLAASADSDSYSWTASEFSAAGTADDIRISYAVRDTGSAKIATEGSYQFKIDNGAQANNISYQAMMFRTVAKGTYTITFDLGTCDTKDYNIHVLSSSVLDDEYADIDGRTNKVNAAVDSGNYVVETISIVKKQTTSISFTAELPKSPIIILAATKADDSVKAFFRFNKVTFTAQAAADPVAELADGTKLNDVAAVTDALNNDKSVKLLKNITFESGAILSNDATLDLNGMTVSGDLVINGTVKDSVGGGVFANEPVVSGEKVALATTGGYVVVNYAVKNDTTTEGNNTKYWLRVELDGAGVNVDAYALASADANFKIQLKVLNGGVEADKVIGLDALIGAWAEDMTSNDAAGNVCFCVTITDGVSYNLTLTPAVTRTVAN